MDNKTIVDIAIGGGVLALIGILAAPPLIYKYRWSHDLYRVGNNPPLRLEHLGSLDSHTMNRLKALPVHGVTHIDFGDGRFTRVERTA